MRLALISTHGHSVRGSHANIWIKKGGKKKNRSLEATSDIQILQIWYLWNLVSFYILSRPRCKDQGSERNPSTLLRESIYPFRTRFQRTPCAYKLERDSLWFCQSPQVQAEVRSIIWPEESGVRQTNKKFIERAPSDRNAARSQPYFRRLTGLALSEPPWS